ncbi:MAG: hypothetical protein HKN39_06505 [Flavobacteriales bacterium]|nr:hypothetical protein [Flavobacteriales bacterium]
MTVFTHCKKENNGNKVVIQGQVRDVLSGDPAAGISVDFLIQGIVDGVFNNSFQNVDEDVTNANGEYRIEFEKGTPSTYRFELSGEGYYSIQQDENPDDFTVNEDNDFDLELNSRAWLKVKVVNEGTVNNGDNVTFALTTVHNDCADCCTSDLIELSGSVNEMQFCEVFGGSYAFADGVINDAIFGQSNLHDSVYVVPMDTTELKISF